MKLSLSWIFDHIIGSWKDHDIATLIQQFNMTTAEIESFTKINLELANFFLVRAIEVKRDSIVVFCPELVKEFSLAKRGDVESAQLFMVKKDGDKFRWATLADWQASKEGHVPALLCKEDDIAGAWKNYVEQEDYILEIDNKSITNRPDLWGHRGIAREIAAILDLPLVAQEMLLAELPIKQYEEFASGIPNNPFTVKIEDVKAASRFAGLYVPEIAYQGSWIWMAHRLARVDARPIDAIVDLTNYVMLDLSEPMHAFDAEKISSKTLGPKWAMDGQKLELLDGEVIELTSQDLVISDDQNPIALAGVMGGRSTAVGKETSSLFLEAACFDATTIRKTAQRFHKRTEASTRFEKSLDPNQNVSALLRFLKLADQEGMHLVVAEHIISLGTPADPKIVEVSHSFIEQCIGVQIEEEFVEKTLLALEFGVEKYQKNDLLFYRVSIPTFRATKDIGIPEDIVEEIARFYGYGNIPLSLPTIKIKPFDNQWVHKKDMIKELCAFAMKAHEVQNYALYDEEFLQEIKWQPENAATIKNPVSEHWKKLVTSLIPHLIKNVLGNVAEYDKIRFFEWNTIWHRSQDKVIENKSLAGIFFSRHEKIDFYQAKESLNSLFDALQFNVSWKKKLGTLEPWYHPYQTATLHYADEVIGSAGTVNEVFLAPLTEGDAFIFELDAEKLHTVVAEQQKFKLLPKFPGTSLDISMFVPLQATVAQVSAVIEKADSRIYQVALVDFFEKDDWPDKRSITMRLQARELDKTLTKAAIDDIYKHVVIALKKIHATIR